MALTITNTNTLNLLNIINRISDAQSKVLTQLSTGLKINRGADDPAGLIAMESLNFELTAVNAALNNNQRADAMLTVADGALTEISSLLTEIESLVVASSSEAGLSAGERAANQAQIDSAISSINRIANTTTFNGRRLLDGTMSIRTTGVNNTEIGSLRVYSRGTGSSNSTISVVRTASAKTASASFGFMGTAATASGATTVAITGTLGTATITITSGSTQAQMVAAINNAKDLTGVSAVATATSIDLDSTGFGTDEFISVDVLSGGNINPTGVATTSSTADDIQNTSRVEGVDAQITINGVSTGVDGLDVSYNANGTSLSFSLTSDFGSGNTANTTSTFTVQASGGATFQLGTNAATRSTIGINSLAAFRLGGGDSGGFLSDVASGGGADLNTDVETSLKIVRKAMTDVVGTRGRIGGFQKFQIQTSINSLNAAKLGLSAARSVIGDTDYAVATAELNRQSVLLNAGISLLGLANQQAAQILSLLG